MSDLRENVGGAPEQAPAGKYMNKPESQIYDEPAFVDSSSTDGGTAADVPISPYVMIGIDLDQEFGAPVYDGQSNTGSVPFTDNWAYFTLGVDKQVSEHWVLGGSIKQKSTFGVQAQENVSGSNIFAPAASVTEARIQAAYGSDYGLANIIRVELLSGQYGAPGQSIDPVLRFEDYLRYDTQYNKLFYQLVGARARAKTNGAWDARAFIGQGFQFSQRDTYEVSVVQEFEQLGNVSGAPTTYAGSNTPVGVISKQMLTNSYTHVFANKTSLGIDANWVGSTYFSGNYQSGLELEANFRIPF